MIQVGPAALHWTAPRTSRALKFMLPPTCRSGLKSLNLWTFYPSPFPETKSLHLCHFFLIHRSLLHAGGLKHFVIMDSYIQTISSLDGYNPQALAPDALDQALASLKQQLLKTEAAKLLLAAKEVPFSRIALSRLSSLLSLVFKPEKQREPKIVALRGLDSVSLIICGLCLTQKALEGMRKDLFDTFREQAVIASQANVKLISKSDEINKIVLNSVADEEFLKRTYSHYYIVNTR